MDRTVVVTMVAVRVVQVAVDQVIDVIAMRHRLMAAAGTVDVILVMAATAVSRRTLGRVGRGYRQLVLLNHSRFLMVQVAIVQVIDVAFVDDARVTATRSVLMGMISVGWVRMTHGSAPSFWEVRGALGG